MKHLAALLGLLLLCTGVAGQEESAGPGSGSGEAVAEYIRYLEAEGGDDRLQTAVSRFRRGPVTVDLVAVVHLADAAYFDELNAYFGGYDVVLYEMIGGAHSTAWSEASSVAAEEMGGVRKLQAMASRLLDLEFQLDGIDYEASNFVHADADWERYHALMEARNQSFATLFQRAMKLGKDGELDFGGLPNDEASMNRLVGRLVTALSNGDSDELKRIAAPMIGEAEAFVTKIEGEDGTVLVSERNEIVMEKLEEEMGRRRGGSYAIFYGAGHMPDLERRLVEEGFRPDETAWVTAWTMAGDPSETETGTGMATGASVDFLLKMLEENPGIMEGIRRLGKTLEALQGGR